MLFFLACASIDKEPVVHQISFQGNGGYWSATNDENLRSAMKQKTNQNLAFLAPDLWMTPYNSQMLKQDAHRIELWYAHHGYFDAKFQGWNIANYPALFSSHPHLAIEGTIDQGKPALIRSVNIVGDMYGTLKRRIQRVNFIKKGDVFSMEDVEYLEYAINSFLHDRSYALPEIDTEVLVWPEECALLKHHKGKCLIANLEAYCGAKCAALIQSIEDCEEDRACISTHPYQDFIQPEKGTVVDLQLHVAPGPSYRFGRIHLKGETTIPLEPVLDKILVDAEVTPGSSFTSDKLYAAQEALYNMGLFSVVNIIPNYEKDVGLAHLDVELTQSSFGNLKKLHHRMPLILDTSSIFSYLDEGVDFDNSYQIISDRLSYHRVSKMVNSVKINTDDCIKSI